MVFERIVFTNLYNHLGCRNQPGHHWQHCNVIPFMCWPKVFFSCFTKFSVFYAQHLFRGTSSNSISLNCFIYQHQITFWKINFSIPPPPVYNKSPISYSMAWTPESNIWSIWPGVKLLNKTILNIMSNFVPNWSIKINLWINRISKEHVKEAESSFHQIYQRVWV